MLKLHAGGYTLIGNGSRLSPEELDGRAETDAESPESFARSSLTMAERFDLSIIGGCCGTDERHIRSLADAIVHRRR